MTYLPTHTVKEGPDHQVLATGLIFHGTMEDLLRLAVAIEHNCETRRLYGAHTTAADARACPAHGIAFDQRVLNGLAWMIRFSGRLRMQEDCIGCEATYPAYPENFREAA